jgi:SAM-dependent methyltransferase
MGIKDNAFDTILLFEVLEHIFYPHRAIQEIYRILRPGGICLLSTRFIFQYHPSPNDYFRFSRDALERLFGAFSDIEILAHGNQWQTTWQLILARELELPRPFFVKILRRLNKVFACTNKPDNRAPLGFLVRAVK